MSDRDRCSDGVTSLEPEDVHRPRTGAELHQSVPDRLGCDRIQCDQWDKHHGDGYDSDDQSVLQYGISE